MHLNRIGIVGVGPRGLTVLERIVAHERQQKSSDLEVLLFDPQEPGCGCHDPEQPDFHLVNTVAGQLTLFSDDTVIGAGPVMGGPTFYQWLQTQSRIGTMGPVANGDGDGDGDADLSADAYYSRGLFGRYLQWVFRYVSALAPSHVKIRFAQSAIDHAQRDERGGWVLHTCAERTRVDYLFLTTGHTKPALGPGRSARVLAIAAHETRVVDDAYPMRTKLARIRPGMTVAVEGMGLSAFDVVAELTLGRGGRFSSTAGSTETAAKTVYIPSGGEPRIVMFSRSGVPLGARAVNQKGVSGQYRARFLRVAPLRELRVCRQLDFNTDVLPLLLADMEYAYCEAYLRQAQGPQGPAAAQAFCDQFAATADALQRQALVARHIAPQDRFSWAQMAQPVPPHALLGRQTFGAWLCGHLQRDLHEAQRGNLGSPLKAACDVLRDLRDTLRAAIEFGGLTEASHRWVLSEFMPVMNRLAVGPPAARISEMLALIEAGVLTADFGPGATCQRVAGSGLMQVQAVQTAQAEHAAGQPIPVDVLVKARISMHSPGDDASPLLQGLLRDGHARLFHNGSFHPGGIDIDQHHRWIGRDGSAVENAWALGIPTEGIKFCTYVIPRTGVNSSAMADAGRAVAQMLSMIGATRGDPLLPGCQPDELPSEAQALVTASQFGGL